MVLEHEAIQREMAKQARTDPLTGLLNRRAFIEEMARQIDRLDREGLPGKLMFADLDNFKPLNDGLGHEAGDEALRRVAKLLRDTVRPTDLVARLGCAGICMLAVPANWSTSSNWSNAPLKMSG
jgi:diguanylate cyclase (GGDEF)-like protein